MISQRENMQLLAKAIADQLPKGYCFFLLVGPSEDVVKKSDGRADYVSNMHREDALNCMKEFILKSGAAEDWMKHIK